MFLTILICLILATAFMGLFLSGALAWVFWVAIACAVIFVIGYIALKIYEHKIDRCIRKLVYYEREHQGEVPTFLEIMVQKGVENKELERTYKKELDRYNKLHEAEV